MVIMKIDIRDLLIITFVYLIGELTEKVIYSLTGINITTYLISYLSGVLFG